MEPFRRAQLRLGAAALAAVLGAGVWLITSTQDAATPDDNAARQLATKLLSAVERGQPGTGFLCPGTADAFTASFVHGATRISGFSYADGETTFRGSSERDLLFVVRGAPSLRAVNVDEMGSGTSRCVARLVPNPPGRY